MKKMSVEFKGTKDGVIIYCLEGFTFEQTLAELSDRLQQRAGFFADAQVRVNIGARTLSEDEKERLAATIRDNSSLKFAGFQVVGEKAAAALPDHRLDDSQRMEGFREDRCLVIKRTLRSGQSIRFAGSVVIFGDINPGAEVVVKGDIMVFGTVRGTVHAGAAGDREASVAALRLAPAQLRIADMYSRSPDEGQLPPYEPECARISDGGIVINVIDTKASFS